jgi:hypothetical protein
VLEHGAHDALLIDEVELVLELLVELVSDQVDSRSRFLFYHSICDFFYI